MTKEVMTANKAVAEAVRLAKPQVIPVYPITPQTTISEYLAQYVADEKIDAKYENGILNITLPKKEVTVTKATKEIKVS